MKLILKHAGLYNYPLKTKNYKKPSRYRSIKRFTATVNGVAVQFSTEDLYSNSWFFPRYAGGRIHERKVTEMLVKALQGSKCFVDVGTNLGWYTCIASKHMPNGTVYGFEMDDLNFAILENNLAINECTNVEVYNMAVSSTSETVRYKREINKPSPEFRLQSDENSGSSLGYVSVNSIPLDNFLEIKGVAPDVIKIDVEGAEMDVIKGMKRTLSECKPDLFVEIHPRNLHYFDTSTTAILSLLIEDGYRVFEIEDMRDQERKREMKPLRHDTSIEHNAMLYATVEVE